MLIQWLYHEPMLSTVRRYSVCRHTAQQRKIESRTLQREYVQGQFTASQATCRFADEPRSYWSKAIVAIGCRRSAKSLPGTCLSSVYSASRVSTRFLLLILIPPLNPFSSIDFDPCAMTIAKYIFVLRR
jgi:hypothetical protein